MAKAKKLPSGNWRVQVFSHKSSSGKNVYESFTASTKAEAEMLASQFKAKKGRKIKNDLTVAESIDQYINVKEGVLSPSTIKAYRSMQGTAYQEIGNIRINRLTAPMIQQWVSDQASKVSAKTVKNTYGLLTASLRFSHADLSFNGITLPTYVKKRSNAPSDADIGLLYNEASDKLKVCIALAAFGSMRRGEVCALQYEDIHGRTAYIHADIVQGSDRKWVYKDYPKTSDSIREVILPQEVIDLIGTGTGFITSYTPAGLAQSYIKLRKRLGLDIRFHDLRHYFASIGAVLNIPDTYLASFGGWRQNSPVMKEVYQNKIVPIADGYANRMSDHFSKIISGM